MTGELLEIAVDAARAAGELLLGRFGAAASGLSTKSSGTDPVSDADRDAESLIVRKVSEARPGDGILAEEGGSAPAASGVRWVIDPLDGTVNFLYSIPHWAVSIAVEDASGTLAGVVFDACRGELFTAVRDGPAELGGRPISCSRQTQPARALIATGFGYDPDARVEQARVAGRLIGRVRDLRRAGTASLDLAWTACGRLDGYYESGLSRWDLDAGALLVRCAGGRTSELPVPIAGRDGIVASGAGLHDALLAVVREASSG